MKMSTANCQENKTTIIDLVSRRIYAREYIETKIVYILILKFMRTSDDIEIDVEQLNLLRKLQNSNSNR